MTVRSREMLAVCGMLAAMLAACSGEDSPQVITGHFELSRGALAIRAITDDNVVTATPVRTDGSFTLTLPAGSSYRLEVLTSTGVKNIVMRSGNVLRDLSFKVCQPQDPFDVGDVGDPNMDGLCAPGDVNCTPCDPMSGEMCPEPPKECQPDDPNCAPPPGCESMTDPNCGGCDPMTDPSCGGGCDPNDPSCGSMCSSDGTCCYPDGSCCKPEPDGTLTCCYADGSCCYGDGTCCSANDPNCAPPPTCQPGDPNCEPPKCDPTIDPMCCYADGTCPPPPPPCDPATDPTCDCNATGTCGCTDMNDPNCVPPCENPMDPSTCKDPCIEDPAQCGCTTPDCWTEPEPCCDANGMCDPGDGMEPDNVPTDFGCE